MRKIYYLLLCLTCLITPVIYSIKADAANTITALHQPIVKDEDAQQLGRIRVELVEGTVKKGEILILRLPSYASFNSSFITEIGTTFDNNKNQLIIPALGSLSETNPFKVRMLNTREIHIESNMENIEEELTLYIQLGDINIRSGSYGSIQVVFEAPPGTGYPVGKVNAGTVIGKSKSLIIGVNDFKQIDNEFEMNLTITENEPEAFGVNQTLRLLLPDGFEWADSGIPILVKGEKAIFKIEKFDKELKLKLQGVDSNFDDKISPNERIKTTMISAWKIPLKFKLTDDSIVESGNIKIKVIWGNTHELTVGSYTKLQPPKYVVFKIGELSYFDNDKESKMDTIPYISEGYTYLPIRYVAEAIGVDQQNILWNGISKTATILKDSKGVQVKLDSKDLRINNHLIHMDVPVKMKDGRLMLPIRYIVEAFGIKIDWDAVQKEVKIVKENNI